MLKAQEDKLADALQNVFGDAVDLSKEDWKGFWLRARGQRTPNVLRIAPGVGKTSRAIQLVNEYYKNHRLSTVYCLPSHKLCKEVLVDNPTWVHWRGHSQFECDEYQKGDQLRKAGFIVDKPKCNCGYYEQKIDGKKPTVTVLDYLKPTLHSSLWGITYAGDFPDMLAPEIEKFDLRIVDEMDFGRFVPEKRFTQDDVLATTEHEVEIVKRLADAIDSIMSDKEFRLRKTLVLSGNKLHQRVCDEMGLTAESLRGELLKVTYSQARKRWFEKDRKNPPKNLPLYLVPILRQELSGEAFNPRIHLSPKHLTLRYRETPPTIVPTLFLDASADVLLLDKLFSSQGAQSIDVTLPDNVKTYQWFGEAIGRKQLGFSEDAPESERDESMRTVIAEMKRLKLPKKVGVVTFEKWQTYVTEKLTDAGYEPTLMYYWNLRSSNKLKDLDALVLLGSPRPNGHGFVRELQGFFFDDDELPIKNNTQYQKVVLRDGSEHEVVVRRYYGDDRVTSYYDYKCQEELFQAIHRLRPLRAETEKKVLVFSEIPIRDVPVDELLGPWQEYVNTIQRLCEADDQVTSSDIARSLGEDPPGKIRKRIDSYREFLASLAGVGLAGTRFVKV